MLRSHGARALQQLRRAVHLVNADTVTQRTASQPEYVNQFTVRFDQKLTANQQLTVYYYFENDASTAPFSTFQGAGGNFPVSERSLPRAASSGISATPGRSSPRP